MDYNDDNDYNEYSSPSSVIGFDSKSINDVPISENDIDRYSNTHSKTDDDKSGIYYIIY